MKFIFFDIGGVVVNSDFEAIYRNFAQRVGVSPQFVTDYHYSNPKEMLLGELTFDDFCQEVIKAGANRTLDLKKIWIEEGIKHRELNTELLQIIHGLRRNYRVGVLSNCTEGRVLLDNEVNLYKDFDFKLLSCVEHLIKPDPRFFQLALERSRSKPEETVFTDDQEQQVAAARELGLHGILFTDNQKLLGDL